MKNKCVKKTESSKGSVLVITIVITAVLLAIGITLASILEKDILRQAYGRQSQIAMNIANSALECTLFNDFRRHAFQTVLVRKHDTVDCGELYQVRKGVDWSVAYVLSSDETDNSRPSGTGLYRFIVIDSAEADLSGAREVPCAHVVIKKVCSGGVDLNNANICSNGSIGSSIEVKGYSSCSSGEAESDRGLVRWFKVYY